MIFSEKEDMERYIKLQQQIYKYKDIYLFFTVTFCYTANVGNMLKPGDKLEVLINTTAVQTEAMFCIDMFIEAINVEYG